jgi:hypothetical protein
MANCIECSRDTGNDKSYPYGLCKDCYFQPSVAKQYRPGGSKEKSNATNSTLYFTPFCFSGIPSSLGETATVKDVTDQYQLDSGVVRRSDGGTGKHMPDSLPLPPVEIAAGSGITIAKVEGGVTVSGTCGGESVNKNQDSLACTAFLTWAADFARGKDEHKKVDLVDNTVSRDGYISAAAAPYLDSKDKPAPPTVTTPVSETEPLTFTCDDSSTGIRFGSGGVGIPLDQVASKSDLDSIKVTLATIVDEIVQLKRILSLTAETKYPPARQPYWFSSTSEQPIKS